MRKVMRTADASDQNRRGVNGSFPLNYIRFWLIFMISGCVDKHGWKTWMTSDMIYIGGADVVWCILRLRSVESA